MFSRPRFGPCRASPILGPLLLGGLAAGLSGCGSSETSTDGTQAGVTPIYSEDTGRLEQVVSDRDRDGQPDARALMDGATLRRIELDRDQDGRFERTEFYAPGASVDSTVTIERAEETDAAGHVVRREVYRGGAIDRVEEDLDFDGRIDKWESYVAGRLQWVDLDLTGDGAPDRRLQYDESGEVVGTDSDPSGQSDSGPAGGPSSPGGPP